MRGTDPLPRRPTQPRPPSCSREGRKRGYAPITPRCAGGARSLSPSGVRLGADMTTFDDRERAFETKFAREEELAFRIVARRNRLLGQWAAELMKLTPAEADAYAKTVVHADLEEAGDDDVVRKVL